MATHSSVLAWRIPGTGELGVLLSMGSHRVGHDWGDLAVAATCYLFTTTLWLGIIHPAPPHIPIYRVVLFTPHFFFLAVPCGLQDLSALTGTWTRAWKLKAPSPNHWTAREFTFTCHFNDVLPSPPPGVTTYISPLSLPELILIMHPRYSNAVVSWRTHSMPKRNKEPTLNPGFSS